MHLIEEQVDDQVFGIGDQIVYKVRLVIINNAEYKRHSILFYVGEFCL